ncbi:MULTISPECIES: RHS repeat-associated core domain-containing protein [Citrobacter]|uniref:RHS repeat-associated core domain-containing protein n=1 Tax=Citrobacter TaxID=544 RepID=UPI0011DD4E82|nr:hypothetical protein [Citrobacter portucalensis]QEH54772.1 hypothetical protein FXN82_04675 [Citrobacter portucalensis]QLS98420.1 hypothetical protein HV301_03840 [Citrobacter freundii]QLT02995.1 hypothetical protein HV300_03840 [Citrobacter freundii]QMN66117.1 hypothetical protein HVW65_03615 [Citrobacter freundii]
MRGAGFRNLALYGGAAEENLQFAGQYLDRETGVHYNTFRYYAPNLLCWIDPLGLAK